LIRFKSGFMNINIRCLSQSITNSICLALFPLTIAYSISSARAEPTASELTALTQTCTPLAGVGKFSSDEGGSLQFQMCQLKGAIWFKADMDIDCDGGTTQICKADKNYLPETSCSTSLGKPMDASNIPFIVLPQSSNGWNENNYGIRCGTVGAVIFNGKLEYGVFGDRGPEGVIGEASHAMAKRLGINADPNTGGIGTGVTYIIFTGSSAVAKPIEDISKSIELGKQLGATLIAQNSLPQNTSAVKITKPQNGMTLSIGTSISFEGTADTKVTRVKLVADNQWTLAEVPVTQGSWSTIYRFTGGGDRKILAIGFDNSGNQVSTSTIIIRILQTSSQQTDFGKKIQEIASQELKSFDGHKENEEGFWQKIVKYWKEGVGRFDVDTSSEVSSNMNPWSAAFVSYVMKKAGAKDSFPYSSAHYTYITHAIRNKKDENLNAPFVGYKITEYSPQIGDLVCAPRSRDTDSVNYDNALTYLNSSGEKFFSSHCDIVVAIGNNMIDVIGGNVSNSVTKSVLNTDKGKLLINSGRKWITVIKNNLAHL
jgi:Uncharacterized protein conserved in bacteria (DUF2272)/Fungal chitosanase of glycosyl hydrolase group 75